MLNSSALMWDDSPYRIWSLREVLDFSLAAWIEIAEAIHDLRNPLSGTILSGQVDDKEQILEPLRKVAHGCQRLKLTLSRRYVVRLITEISKQPTLSEKINELTKDLHTIAENRPAPTSAGSKRAIKHAIVTADKIDPSTALRIAVNELKQRIDDELRGRVFMTVESEKIDYYKQRQLFGPKVAKNFSSASLDIEEAGKCLALNRSAATVFHLMRVMEVGLRTLGKSLNDPSIDPKRNPSWDSILKKCDSELQKSAAQRCTEWQTDPSFFANATANLRAVKDAWRNPTMHVEINYDEERALEVWNSVRAFMRHLATKLAE